MTIRKKGNPFSGNQGSEKHSGKQNSKSGSHPKRENMFITAPGSHTNDERIPPRNDSLDLTMKKRSSDHRTCFNPLEVQQWVTNSSTEADAFLEMAPRSQFNTLPDRDISASRMVPENTGSFSLSQSVSHVSLQCSAKVPGIEMNYDDTRGSVIASSMNSAIQGSHVFGYSGDVDFSGEQYQSDVWSYPTPADEDVLFANSITTANNEQNLGHEWDPVNLQTGNEVLATTVPGTSQQLTWSPMLAIDTSLSSSYSQNSMLAFQPHTPLSPCTQEDTWCTSQNETLDTDPGLYLVSLGEAAQFPSSSDFANIQNDIRFAEKFNCNLLI